MALADHTKLSWESEIFIQTFLDTRHAQKIYLYTFLGSDL